MSISESSVDTYYKADWSDSYYKNDWSFTSITDRPSHQRKLYIYILVLFTIVYAVIPIAVITIILIDDQVYTNYIFSQNITFIFLAYFIIFTLIIWLLCFQRRLRQPFKSRNFPLLLISTIGGFFLRIWILVFNQWFSSTKNEIACELSNWIINITYPMITAPYLLRSIRLHLLFSLKAQTPTTGAFSPKFSISRDNERKKNPSQTILESKTAPTPKFELPKSHSKSLKSRSTMSNMHLSSEKNKRYRTCKLALWLLISISPFLVIAFLNTNIYAHRILNVTLSPTFPTFSICDSNSSTSILQGMLPWAIYHGLQSVVLFIALILSCRVWQEFSIQGELLVVFISDLIIAILQIVSFYFTKDDDLHWKSDSFSRFLISARVAIFFVVSMVHPLIQSYTNTLMGLNIEHVIDKQAISNLDGVLKNTDSYSVFFNFMDQMEAGELLQFYIQIDVWRDIENGDKRTEEAFTIYNNFLVPPRNDLHERKSSRNSSESIQYEKGRNSIMSDGSYRGSMTTTGTPLSNVHLIVSQRIKEQILEELTANACAPESSTHINRFLFEGAQMDVFNEMRRSYWPLFLQSDCYRQLRRQVRIQNQIHKNLFESQMIDSPN